MGRFMARSEEDRVESKQNRELRKQNIRLKQENRQLKKRLNRLENMIPEEFEDDEVEVAPEPEIVVPKYHCPKCKSDQTRLFKLCKTEYYKCEDCGSKGRVSK